jgi:hypothetical protein
MCNEQCCGNDFTVVKESPKIKVEFTEAQLKTAIDLIGSMPFTPEGRAVCDVLKEAYEAAQPLPRCGACGKNSLVARDDWTGYWYGCTADDCYVQLPSVKDQVKALRVAREFFEKFKGTWL